MIELDISTAVAIYLFLTVVGLLLLWLFFDREAKPKHYTSEKESIWQCNICTFSYVDSQHDLISKCPRCGRYVCRRCVKEPHGEGGCVVCSCEGTGPPKEAPAATPAAEGESPRVRGEDAIHRKSVARELAKTFWESSAASQAKRAGHGVCDYCNGEIALDEGFITGPITSLEEVSGALAAFGVTDVSSDDVTPSLACERCFDAKRLKPWNGDTSGMPPALRQAYKRLAERAASLHSAQPAGPRQQPDAPTAASARRSPSPVTSATPKKERWWHRLFGKRP